MTRSATTFTASIPHRRRSGNSVMDAAPSGTSLRLRRSIRTPSAWALRQLAAANLLDGALSPELRGTTHSRRAMLKRAAIAGAVPAIVSVTAVHAGTFFSPMCGDGFCDYHSGENVLSCPQDCPSVCGNGICEDSYGETNAICPQDCAIPD